MTTKPFIAASFAFALATGVATQAFAAQVPGSVDPSKVEQRFDDQPMPMPGTGTVAVPELPKSSAPSKAAQGKRFTLRGVSIEGSTVYKEEQLKPLFAEQLGKEISLADAQSIAEKITVKYRNEGYILSQAVVPPQQLSDGVLRIRVVEGFIDKVIIEGDVRENSWRHLVQNYGDKIRQIKPLHIATLERYLLLMDDLPGATAKGVVRPSSGTFGAADLVVTVSHKMIEGSLSTDNRGTKFIGPQQYTGTLAANSALGLYERTLLRGITTSPTTELRFFDLQHEEQIGNEGTRLLLTASRSHTRPTYTITTLDIDAVSNAYQGRLQHPFIRSRTKNLVGRAQFDYRNTDTDLLGTNFTNDRLRVARAGGSFDFADNWLGVNLIDAQVSQGLDVFNASETGTRRSRANGDSDFLKWNIDLARTQSLPMGFSLFTAATAQFTRNQLLSSEQFSLGGVGFGSAYDPAELSGDQGIAAKAELRYGRGVGYQYLNSYQLFTYYDIGRVWNTDTSTPDNNSLASAGLGVRANFTKWLSGSAEVGVPLTKKVAVENDHDPRFFFSVTGRF